MPWACRFARLEGESQHRRAKHVEGGGPIWRTSNQEGSTKANGAVAPEQKREGLGLGVEGDVAIRALGIVIRRGHLGPGGVEASAASDLGGRADGGAGEHLDSEAN